MQQILNSNWEWGIDQHTASASAPMLIAEVLGVPKSPT